LERPKTTYHNQEYLLNGLSSIAHSHGHLLRHCIQDECPVTCKHTALVAPPHAYHKFIETLFLPSQTAHNAPPTSKFLELPLFLAFAVSFPLVNRFDVDNSSPRPSTSITVLELILTAPSTWNFNLELLLEIHPGTLSRNFVLKISLELQPGTLTRTSSWNFINFILERYPGALS
jgi:hypothetical protein